MRPIVAKNSMREPTRPPACVGCVKLPKQAAGHRLEILAMAVSPIGEMALTRETKVASHRPNRDSTSTVSRRQR